MTRKDRAKKTIEALRVAVPQPETELDYGTPYELITAVILSAQCTDERVNKITPALFGEFPDAKALAAAEPEDVYPFVSSCSYPNNKSRHLVGMARMVVDEFGGDVPSSVDELVRLPGVGRKTAQVVASVAFGIDALPVDTHVFRVANRIGLAENASTPAKVEAQLKRIIPQEDWSEGHHLLILHGRYRCTARSPQCDGCNVAPYCLYYERLQSLPEPIAGLDKKKGRYYCATRRHYFDTPDETTDRHGTPQIACPRCGSMNVYLSSTGVTTRKVRDFRV